MVPATKYLVRWLVILSLLLSSKQGEEGILHPAVVIMLDIIAIHGWVDSSGVLLSNTAQADTQTSRAGMCEIERRCSLEWLD